MDSFTNVETIEAKINNNVIGVIIAPAEVIPKLINKFLIHSIDQIWDGSINALIRGKVIAIEKDSEKLPTILKSIRKIN